MFVRRSKYNELMQENINLGHKAAEYEEAGNDLVNRLQKSEAALKDLNAKYTTLSKSHGGNTVAKNKFKKERDAAREELAKLKAKKKPGKK